MKDPQCIFCRIVAGEIPCHKVYEDEQVFSFLDIGPLAEGHLLVVPRDHHEVMDELPPETAAALGRVLPKLGRCVRKATGARGYNILQNNGGVSGQEVLHLHVHIIPRKSGDGLGYRWNPSKYPPGRDDEVHKLLLDALEG